VRIASEAVIQITAALMLLDEYNELKDDDDEKSMLTFSKKKVNISCD
jgi:hypothetical protein